MFERFTDMGRRAVVISQQEARALAQKQIGPLHLLLGVLMAENGTAGPVLASLGVEPEGIRRAAVAKYGTDDVDDHELRRPGVADTEGHIPFAEETKKAMEHSLRESLGLDHTYIGTEHLVLGLLTDDSPEVGDVLAGLGAQPQAVRDAVLVRLGGDPAEP
ncbi:Clp protease N-terminal domain-containing protein [Mycobacterium sp. ITM-2016-00318]|uniref:Clp protease N-terminal domain-containing protein n=1 Tax=Mycobacterium sp. ITM-2016-00318 TaxID=2099693 RepID=UPI000CF917BB|nr:Clp protease N-terminal domain-containing protein [Mycobacterium sp. ITM-2016-00318]WNG94279.1 Clp protease N-terminal domain-containing protein [Mycobacterium sp. ITM-2016-00318]